MKKIALTLVFASVVITGCAAQMIRAHRGPASVSVEEQLRQQLGQVWEAAMSQPGFPKFLVERREDEAMYAGPPLSQQQSLAILQADQTPYNGKFIDLFPDEDPNYEGLARQIGWEHVINTLKAGKLEVRAGYSAGNSEQQDKPGIYLMLLKKTDPRFTWKDVEFRFHLTILDERNDYFVNPAVNYGNFDLYSAAPLWNRGRVKFYIDQYLRTTKDNEFVFTSEIDLKKYLSAIYVKKGKRAKMLAEIKKAKIPPPGTLPWDQLVYEQ
jgi:hypothetical protein